MGPIPRVDHSDDDTGTAGADVPGAKGADRRRRVGKIRLLVQRWIIGQQLRNHAPVRFRIFNVRMRGDTAGDGVRLGKRRPPIERHHMRAERHLANRTQGDVAFGREHPDSLLRGKRAARRLGVVPEFDDQTID